MMSVFGLERVTVLKVGLVAALLAACLLALVGSAKPIGATFPGANGKIAFGTNRDGNNEIYTMDADGSNQINLTNNAAEDHSPSWSPDGTKIAFQSFREASGDDIYVMNADGSNQTNLTNNATFDHSPSWSPDGTKIAFMSELDPLTSVIYTMNAEGSNQTRLTNGSDCCPSWQRQPIPVVYSFSGFYQPVDNLPTLNKTKPGKTIPVRFSLGGDRGLKIFESGYPRSEAITCETGAQVDDIEQTELGKNGLTYDPVSDRYTYHWATSSAWSGCRQFVMKLKDGSIQRANFTFK